MATVYASNSAWDYEGPQSEANASYIFSFFRQQGWSDNAICGLLGNTTWESYNNPGFWERGGYGGFGIVQWTPSGNYRDWAIKKGYPCGSDYSDPEKYLLGQCRRIMYEFEHGGEWYATRSWNLTFQQFSQTTMDPGDAAEAFCWCYERPASATANVTARRKFAKNWLDKLSKGQLSRTSAAYSAVQWIKAIANDPSHGYDWDSRWGPDYDCSSLVISAYQQAGIDLKGHGANSTHDMYEACIACGFTDVTSQINLKTGEGLIPGDILLNRIHHAAMYVGDGKIVQASINEFGGVRGGQSGDQTGSEINTKNYYVYKYGWNYVLRGDGLVGFGGYGAAGSVYVVRATKVATENWQDSVVRN